MAQEKSAREMMRDTLNAFYGGGDKNKDAKERADKIANILNSMQVDPQAIGMALTNEHRTLQQTFAGVAIGYFKALLASEAYDGRNEAAYRFAESIEEQLNSDKAYLPFI